MGKKEEKKPIFKKAWFWIVIGSVLGAALIVFTTIMVVKPIFEHKEEAKTTIYEPRVYTATDKISSGKAFVYLTKEGNLTMHVNKDYIRPFDGYILKPENGKEYVAISVAIGAGAVEGNEVSFSTLNFSLVDKEGKFVSMAVTGSDDYYLSSGVATKDNPKVGFILFKIDKTQKLSDLRLEYSDIKEGFKIYFDF